MDKTISIDKHGKLIKCRICKQRGFHSKRNGHTYIPESRFRRFMRKLLF